MQVFSFLKKTYKILGVFVFVISFFVFYNTYLVDRSIINLKIALEKVAEAKTKEDFKKIQPLLKLYLHKQIAQKEIPIREVVLLEAVENIAATAKEGEQTKDASIYLRSVVDEIIKKRGAFLSAVDALNSRIYAPLEELPRAKLSSLEKGLLSSIETIKDKTLLQEAYYNLGNIYIQTGDINKAEEAFFKSVESDPSSPLVIKVKFNLAWAYKSAGKYEEAVKYFEELSRESREKLLLTSSKFETADTYYKKGDYREAIDRYSQLATEGAELGIGDLALYQAAYISFYNLGNSEEASKEFVKLSEKFPESELNKHALAEVRPAMSKDYRLEGFKLLDEKKYKEAMESFKSALRVAPSDIHSLSGMSICLYWLNRKREAYFRARLVAKFAPFDELAITNTLFVFVNCGKIDQAIKIAEDLLSKNKVAIPQFYYNLGSAYYMKKDFDKALAQFNRVSSLGADSASLRNKLGNTYWGLGNYNEAIKEFDKAIGLDQRYALAYFNRGVVNFSINKLPEAYVDFMNAVGIDPIFKKAVQPYLQRIIKTLKYEPK